MNNTVGASPISYDDTTRFNTETQLHCFLFFCFSIITQLNSKPVFFLSQVLDWFCIQFFIEMISPPINRVGGRQETTHKSLWFLRWNVSTSVLWWPHETFTWSLWQEMKHIEGHYNNWPLETFRWSLFTFDDICFRLHVCAHSRLTEATQLRKQ